MEFVIESIAVRIPTSAVIPTAIMETVRIVRNKLPRMDCSAIFRFSKKSVPNLILNLIKEHLIGHTSSGIITSNAIGFVVNVLTVRIYLS